MRRWMRAVFELNMPALCRAFGATPAQIRGSMPKVYWLIHRAMDPEVRQRMRLAAVAAGLEIDKKKIHLFNPVKTLGKHTVKIKLHTDVSVELAFDVVSENPIEPVVTEEAPAAEKTEKRSERRPRKETKE